VPVLIILKCNVSNLASTDLLLDTMNGVDVLGTTEALIYCVGSLKFLTGNATIAKQLVHNECIEKLSALLDAVNKLVGIAEHCIEHRTLYS